MFTIANLLPERQCLPLKSRLNAQNHRFWSLQKTIALALAKVPLFLAVISQNDWERHQQIAE